MLAYIIFYMNPKLKNFIKKQNNNIENIALKINFLKYRINENTIPMIM